MRPLLRGVSKLFIALAWGRLAILSPKPYAYAPHNARFM
jgi:hypothetical protein